jgi:ABC-type xylose transport system permease subunit
MQIAAMLFNPINAMIGFVALCVCVAVIIILGKWVLSLIPGVPQPVIVALGLIVFLFLFLLFMQWLGVYTFFGSVR